MAKKSGGLGKVQRPVSDFSGVYSARDMLLGLPERRLAEYAAQVDAYNRTVPSGREYTVGYVPDSLRGPLRALEDLEGTEANRRYFDFVHPKTEFSFGDPDVGYSNHGSVRADSPERARLSAGFDKSTPIHEAAHSDSYLSPNQAHWFGGRMYPGYGDVVYAFRDALKDAENYREADYGGAEEAAARLRAAYGLSPSGTQVAEFFGDAAGRIPLPLRAEMHDVPEGDTSGRYTRRRIQADTPQSALKLLEHTLFPRMRFIEPREPTVLERIRDYFNGEE